MAKPKRASLRSTLSSGQFVLAPGIFDMITARIADAMGFPALYMTGYGVTASHLGLPDAGLATYTDMVGRVRIYNLGFVIYTVASLLLAGAGLLAQAWCRIEESDDDRRDDED